MRAAASSFFRDIQFPSHAEDRRAHELFLLDTYADRKAEERPALRTRIMRVVRALRLPERA